MARGTLGPSLKPLRDLFDGGTTVGLGDGELLRRYAATRDGAAFEALVARHGPMVAATCRAVLRNLHDAEDAFQATFLVLARRAGSIRSGDSLGGWLHRVAYRAAVQKSIESRRRRLKESEVMEMEIPDPARPPLDFDVRSILHEEIDRLSDAERLPVVLCDLEGLTYEQAAGRLRCTSPTVYHRLARGRKRLRDRLIRRGVTAVCAGAAIDTARSSATAAVPTAWVQAAVSVATGGAVPTTVSALTHSLLRSLLMTRLTTMTLAVVLALGSLVSAGLIARGAGGTDAPIPTPSAPATPPIPPARADEPKPAARPDARPGTLTVEARDLRTDAPMPDVRLDLHVWTHSRIKLSATTDVSGTARIPVPAGVRDVLIAPRAMVSSARRSTGTRR